MVQTQQPGLYQVQFRQDDETVARLPYMVKRDTTESHWQQLTEDEQQHLSEFIELYFDAESEVQSQLAQEVAPEEPLWGALLVALLLFLASELLLSNWIGRQRSGVAVSMS